MGKCWNHVPKISLEEAEAEEEAEDEPILGQK